MIFKTTKGGGALTHSLGSNKKLTEADLAYEILQAQGIPMHYQSLVEEVLKRLGISQEAVRIAAALTQINMDTRFMFYGRGEWGLRVWESAKTPKRSSHVSLINKVSSDDDNKNDLEDSDGESVDEDLSETDEVFDDPDEGSHSEKW